MQCFCSSIQITKSMKVRAFSFIILKPLNTQH